MVEKSEKKKRARLFTLRYTAKAFPLGHEDDTHLLDCEAIGVCWPDGAVMLWHQEEAMDQKPPAYRLLGFASFGQFLSDYQPYGGVVTIEDSGEQIWPAQEEGKA